MSPITKTTDITKTTKTTQTAPNWRKISGISFWKTEEGCAKLSRICREFESQFRTILCKGIRLFQFPFLQISEETMEMMKTTGIQGANHGFPKQLFRNTQSPARALSRLVLFVHIFRMATTGECFTHSLSSPEYIHPIKANIGNLSPDTALRARILKKMTILLKSFSLEFKLQSQGRALYGPIPVKTEISENFEHHWSILMSGEIHMDQSLVHTFSWGNSYGPMVRKVF